MASTSSSRAARMGLAMHVFEGLLADLGIDLGRAKVTVAEHLLDMADVRAVIQHGHNHGVKSSNI